MRKLIFIALLGAGFMPAQAMFSPVLLSLSGLAAKKTVEVGGSAAQRGVDSGAVLLSEAGQKVKNARAKVYELIDEYCYREDVGRKCEMVKVMHFPDHYSVQTFFGLTPSKIRTEKRYHHYCAKMLLETYAEDFFKMDVSIEKELLENCFALFKCGLLYASDDVRMKYEQRWIDVIKQKNLDDKLYHLDKFVVIREHLGLLFEVFFLTKLFCWNEKGAIEKQIKQLINNCLEACMDGFIDEGVAKIGRCTIWEKKEYLGLQILVNEEEVINSVKKALVKIKARGKIWNMDSMSWIDSNDYLLNYLKQIIFVFFPEINRSEIISYIAESWQDLSEEQLVECRKLERYRDKFCSSIALPKNAKRISGPLFSSYIDRYYRFLAAGLPCNKEFCYNLPSEKLCALLQKLTLFSIDAYKKNNLVLYHGQHSQWLLLEKMCNRLLNIKNGTVTPDDFIRLRFEENSSVTSLKAWLIKRKGVGSWVTPSDRYRFNVLFTNLHVLANNVGSNSFYYIVANMDQTVISRNDDFLKSIFENLGFGIEYAFYIQELKVLFDQYFCMIQEQGNIGRMVCFSLPKALAQSLTYRTHPSGALLPCIINGRPTTDVVEIAENYDQVPFNNEYALILSKEICDPVEAQKAGVVMKAFDGLDRESESYKAFETEFDRVTALVAGAYHERMAQGAENV